MKAVFHSAQTRVRVVLLCMLAHWKDCYTSGSHSGVCNLLSQHRCARACLTGPFCSSLDHNYHQLCHLHCGVQKSVLTDILKDLKVNCCWLRHCEELNTSFTYHDTVVFVLKPGSESASYSWKLGRIAT